MKVENMIPEIYYKESRDVSYIGRLFEILFNYLKSTSDLVGKGLKDEYSITLIDLLCTTLGFKIKHKYINKDLIAISSSFTDILKKKGSIQSIEECIKILLNSQYLDEIYDIQAHNDTCIVEIYLSNRIQDTVLLEDLFDYILPAGWIYNLYRIAVKDSEYKDKYEFSDNLLGNKVYEMKPDQLSQVSRPRLPGDINVNDAYSDYDDDPAVSRSQVYTAVVYQPIDPNNPPTIPVMPVEPEEPEEPVDPNEPTESTEPTDPNENNGEENNEEIGGNS